MLRLHFSVLSNQWVSFFFTWQEDIFTLEAAELGNIYKLKLRHDNSNFSPCWFVDRVDIRDVETDKLYPFVCERWLSKKKEDKKIQRMFYVKGYEVCQSKIMYWIKILNAELSRPTSNLI